MTEAEALSLLTMGYCRSHASSQEQLQRRPCCEALDALSRWWTIDMSVGDHKIVITLERKDAP